MNAPAAVSSRAAVKEQLEAALRAGAGSDQLLEIVDTACAASPNAPWEALAIVDQYYRRRRISEDLYRLLKSRIQSLALGRPQGPEADARPQRGGQATTSSRAQGVSIPPDDPSDTTPAPILVGPPRVGLVLRGRYTLESHLDYASGVVFQALDGFRRDLPQDEQRVAIRFPTDAADAQREFFRAQQLAHPNIARVLEFDRDGELAYYTMELQRGELLRDVLKRAENLPLPPAQSLAIVREVANALAYALSQGVVHGHLDTGSVLLGHGGKVKVLNYGLPRSNVEVFEPGNDVAALSSIAYELLAGHPPYNGVNPDDAQQRGIRLRRPAGLSRSQWRALQRGLEASSDRANAITLPEWLRAIEVHKAATFVAPATELAESPRHRGLGRSRPGAAIAMLAVVAGIVVTMYYVLPHGPAAPATGNVRPAMPAPAMPVAEPPSVRSAETSPPAAPAPPAVVETPAVANPRPEPAARRSDPAPAGTARTQRASEAARMPVAPAGEDGVALLGFQSESYTVAPGESAARIPVRRQGGTRNDVGFVWWTESGTARAGDDFVTFGQQREVVPAGEKAVSLYIPLSGGDRKSDSEFYVNIAEPSGGAKLGNVARLKVVISAAQ